MPIAYTLEVSSPGLDRPLRQLDDYRRFAGRRAKIVMRERWTARGFSRAGSAASTGPTCSSTADDGRTHRVPVDVITRANLEVEF